MATKSYKLWVDKILLIPWYGGSTEEKIKKEISWDGRKTEVEKAELRFSGRASGSTQIYVYMNEQEISAMHILWGIIDDMKLKEATDSVSGILINGLNNFEARFCKIGVWPFDVSITFTLELVITYTGIEPELKPWYEKYAIPVGIGIVSTVAGGMVVGKLTERGEKQ